ncbi:MAG: VWA domain-containing protein, partial [Thermoanaerobaculia bacterium]
MRARLALLILIAVAPLFAQVKETVNVTVVEVPVTVIDRDGNPIRGLTAANFEVLDEGKKRAVTAFDKIDFASKESMQAMSPMNPAARRNFMLLFDLSYSNPKSLVRAQQSARDFVKSSVERRDLVSVATIDVNKGFRLLTAFTTDRALIASAIEHPEEFQGNDPLQIAGTVPWKEMPTSGGGERQNTAAAEFNEMLQRAGTANDAYNRQRVDRQISLLSGLAKTLRSVNGRKHVVLLSEGFDPRLVQGRDAKLTEQQLQENQAIERGEIWKVDTDNRYGNSSSLSIVDQMATLFRRSDVFLHAIDIQGVRVTGDSDIGSRGGSNEGLFLLAHSTGGQLFKNSNDIKGDFDRMVKQQEVVYILGFQAPSGAPGKFHDLKVKLVNVPGGRATARAGYYETGGENAVERSLSNAEIIVNDIPQDAIHVASLAAGFPTSGANAQVPVILEISGPDVMRAAQGRLATTAEIFVYAFDDEGLVRDSLFQRVGLDLQKLGPQLSASGVKYYTTLALPPGHYVVKTLVRVADTNARGFIRRDLNVPGAGDMAISQPFFYEDGGKWVMVKGPSHDKTNAPYPFEVNGEPFIPSAAVSLAAGQPRKFAVFVYDAAPDEVTWDLAPQTKVLSQLKSALGSKVVFQVDGATAAPLNVTV